MSLSCPYLATMLLALVLTMAAQVRMVDRGPGLTSLLGTRSRRLISNLVLEAMLTPTMDRGQETDCEEVEEGEDEEMKEVKKDENSNENREEYEEAMEPTEPPSDGQIEAQDVVEEKMKVPEGVEKVDEKMKSVAVEHEVEDGAPEGESTSGVQVSSLHSL